MATKGPKLRISEFVVTEDRLDCGRLWSRWVERFEREIVYQGVSLTAKPEIAKAALLIHAGMDVEDIHDSLPNVTKPEDMSDANWTEYAKSKAKLTAYFSPGVCNDFALYELISTRMMGGETVAAYAVRLRELAKRCSFENWNADKMIKVLILSNMQDDELRIKLLHKDRTLDEVLKKAQQKDDATARAKEMKKEKVNKMGTKWPNKKSQDKQKDRNASQEEGKCKFCGHEKHPYEECPAKDRHCGNCGKKGHYSRSSVCTSSKKEKEEGKKDKKGSGTKKVGAQQSESDTESDSSCNKIEVLSVKSKVTLMRVKMNGEETIWQPDTGTKKNLMDATHLKRFEKETGSKMELISTKARLFPYGSDEQLTVIGKFRATFEAGDEKMVAMVYVTKETTEYPLISEDTAVGLKLVSYNQDYIVNKVGEPNDRDVERDVKARFPELFTGKIGRAVDRQVKIMTNENVVPVAQRPRRIPIHLTEKAEAKIKQMLEEDVIEKFPDDEPRSWINPNVYGPKPNGDIRHCLDMRMTNMAILRPYTTIPTLDDVKAKFAGAQRFSKLDLKEAYNQFELTPESRNLLAFYGPDGLYRFKRLNYGTKSSQDIMQIELQRILAGTPNQTNMADDIMVGGSIQQHDEALMNVCEKLSKAGITLNPDKCIFDVKEVSYMGQVFSETGIKPDPKHIKNLNEAKAPRTQGELRSFLGMAGYSMNFIQGYASIINPLRELQKKKRWDWNKECQEAFERLRNCLTESTMLHHYVPGRETQLMTDASNSGLGACLMQKSGKDQPYHVVSYRSRALKDAETRYSATEKEALAVGSEEDEQLVTRRTPVQGYH